MTLLNATITKIGAITIILGITLSYPGPKNQGTILQLVATNPNIIGNDRKKTKSKDFPIYSFILGKSFCLNRLAILGIITVPRDVTNAITILTIV